MNSSNTLHLVFNDLEAYIEESGENKYLIFALTDNNKHLIDKYTEVWNKIREQIKLIIGDKVIKYGKDSMEIKFKTDQNYLN